ncbi:MAG TPA: M13 family metallopeptidase [Candidatus Acidoferrales bacterium]|nr:M13 family metallopeptidase [Candidatus Acidoferrales bacterium]
MRRSLLAVALMLAVAASVLAQSDKKVQEPKVIHTFDLNAIDKTADPCTDFYQYACGNWMKNNPIPSDQASWGRFEELDQNNQLILRNLLERVSDTANQKNANDQKIGDFYASCMDEAAIEKKGLEPLKPELERINKLTDKSQIPAYLAYLHVTGPNAFFGAGSEPDAKNASMTIVGVSQAGLGLPNRDYYFKTDKNSEELRQKYVQHVANMFKLLGYSPEKATAAASTVMHIETELARVSLDPVALRDPQQTYHKMNIKQLAELSPAFNWNGYFAALPVVHFDDLNVGMPEFFKGMSTLMNATPLDDVKTYLTWQLVHSTAAMLPTAFVNENFAFYGKTLTGQLELRPRWKRCVRRTDEALGEALGKAYVDQTFGAEGKARTLAMVKALEKALDRDIKEVPWMTEETKKQALVKLAAIENKIGYPDKWRDYSKLEIVRGDALGNFIRGTEFESKRQFAKVGKPVDKLEWEMTPPTVNAYYNPLQNNINFPAGILQPPFFDRNGNDATNYGAIGVVIGHELTHGFDDEGRQYDAQGNLRDWWTAQDAKAFEERAQCLVDEYAGFTPLDDVHLNGKLTLGENTADNGGLRIAQMALNDVTGGKGETISGFTPEQRFFLGYAQVWCENVMPEFSRMTAQSDPHSPGKFRVIGAVQNSEQFRAAFQCKPGSKMIPAKTCRVW